MTEEKDEVLADAGEERNVLACVYQSVDAWLTVMDKLTIKDFTHPVNRAIWTVLDDCYQNEVTPSPATIHDRLDPISRKTIDELGGWKFFDSLNTVPISPSNAAHHAKKLTDLTVLRRGRTAGEEISKLAESKIDAEAYVKRVDELVNDIPGEIGNDVVLLGSIAEAYVTNKMAHAREIPGLEIPFPELNQEIQGLQAGRMYVVGARTGVGKSIFLLNCVKHLGLDNEIPILYITTEQTQEDEVSRLISMSAEIRERTLENGTFADMNGDTPERVAWAVEKIKTAPIYFQHDPLFSFDKLRRTIKKYVLTKGVKAVFFDYIKIPTDSIGSRDKWAVVGDLAYGLKAIASDLKIPVVTAVQINRDGAASFKFTGEVDESAFANSDMIVQAASVALVLRPLNKAEEEEYVFAGDKRVITMVKNRHGSKAYKGLYALGEGHVTLKERQRIDGYGN